MEALENRVLNTLSPEPFKPPKDGRVFLVIFKETGTCEVANEVDSVLECAFSAGDIEIVDITEPAKPKEYIGSERWVKIDKFRVS